jgi:tetratricopeptide (TPR) repeat protein
MAVSASAGNVFISYARSDRGLASKLAEKLDRCGFNVWWDQRLTAGEVWDEVIENQLKDAGAVVVLWSEASVASRWVKREARFAIERRKLVPVRIAAVDVPVEFSDVQAEDLIGWAGRARDRGFERLVEALTGLLARGSVVASAIATAAPAPRSFLRPMAWAAAAAGCLAAGVLVWLFGLREMAPALPRADPHRFTVAVANLESDAEGEYAQLIIEAIQESKQVDVLSLPRLITASGPAPDQAERAGHDSARTLLRDTGADVMIWGKVLRLGDKAVPKLYWTAGDLITEPGRYAPTDDLHLPEIFWSDLVHVLRLMVEARQAEVEREEGRYAADQLPEFIAKVRALTAGKDEPGWTAESRGLALISLADALTVLGGQRGENEPLDEAISAYGQAIALLPRERWAMDWARAQAGLGFALWRIGERQPGTENLREAAGALQRSLEVRTRETAPREWAASQTYLGTVFLTLGERETGTDYLEQAVAAYRLALSERQREQAPLEWAFTQNHLGLALFRLGERQSGTERLGEAVAAFRAAMEVQSRERVPMHWAWTQNNLANALQVLGERNGNAATVNEAAAAYRQALSELTRERVPLQWAATTANLAGTLSTLATNAGDGARLKEAVGLYRAALTVFTPDRAPVQAAATEINLAATLRLLGTTERDPALVCEALVRQAAAWQVLVAGGVEAWAKAAEAGAKETLAVLSGEWGAAAGERCLASDPSLAGRLRTMGLMAEP